MKPDLKKNVLVNVINWNLFAFKSKRTSSETAKSIDFAVFLCGENFTPEYKENRSEQTKTGPEIVSSYFFFHVEN